jgi:Tfp pilus assembly protein PilO
MDSIGYQAIVVALIIILAAVVVVVFVMAFRLGQRARAQREREAKERELIAALEEHADSQEKLLGLMRDSLLVKSDD